MEIGIIEKFAAGATDATIATLFRSYDQGCYDHLLTYSRKDRPTRQRERRNALTMYLDHFINYAHEEDVERHDELMGCVQEGSYERLIHLLDDQYFEEPLYHTLNHGKRDFVL